MIVRDSFSQSTERQDDYPMSKPKVAFICVHNSCRSQIAKALGKHLASDVFESFSASTELKDRINPDAVVCVTLKTVHF